MWDAVIAGGGPSGLSLAAHLAAGEWRDRQVLVVDDGSRPLDGRAWAFWSTGGGLLDAAVDRCFDRLRLQGYRQVVDARLDRYRYRVVSGTGLRRAASALIERAPGFGVQRGHVDAVEDLPGGAVVTVDGRAVETRWAFDSVTEGPAARAAAWLTFTGQEVTTSADRFDPRVPVLMDFRTAQDGGVCFVYVMPSGPRQALVEHTRFATRPAASGDQALRAYLNDVVRAAPYQVVRREGARLPLRLPRPRAAAGHIMPIGIRGGMLKASTGYAYGRIQRDSAAIARSLAEQGHPFAPQITRRRHTYLDAVLLDVLAAEPDRLESTFLRLFGRNPADLVLRFLDEDSSLGQEARLVLTLPPLPFLRAMARRTRRMRRPGLEPG